MDRPLTEERKQNLSKKLKGKKKPPRSAEHCAASSKARTGKKRGPYTFKTGKKIPWNKGLKQHKEL
jgi:hypothetical protein